LEGDDLVGIAKLAAGCAHYQQQPENSSSDDFRGQVQAALQSHGSKTRKYQLPEGKMVKMFRRRLKNQSNLLKFTEIRWWPIFQKLVLFIQKSGLF
jgi:hypothetical protein